MNTKNISKANLLKYINSLNLTLFKVPNMLSFSNVLIKDNFKFVLDEIKKTFNDNILAIRSSAADEDSEKSSLAGGYSSVLNVPANNEKKIIEAVNVVIDSYKKKRPLLLGDEIIVQEMVLNTSMSGVVFTYDLNTGAPYYVINYDDKSGTTDTVTSGRGEFANRTLYVHRHSVDKLRSDRFKKLLKAIQELEHVLGNQFLDIEFSLDTELNTHLLQVRKITTQINWNRGISKKVDTTLQGVQSLISKRFQRADGVYGKTTALGQMPDWNPAEIIGRVPRNLASSLYKKVITDDAWRIARAEMGYSIPAGEPLMIMLAGQPFIDTRLSFHSFVPKKIPPNIAEKLVNHWVKELIKKPECHDKIEFDIAITCYSFDFDKKVETLIGDILTKEEKLLFKKIHQQHTIALIKGENKGSISTALDKIEQLTQKQKNTPSIFAMIDDCIQLGTIPFSILARHGFISKTILLSLKELNIVTHDEINQILGNIQTVASELVDDLYLLQENKITIKNFLEKFGHLRPGTYDIRSLRYDQIYNQIFSATSYKSRQKSQKFELTELQRNKINILLEEHGFKNFTTDDLINYIKKATIAREYSKFVFTHSVSNIIEFIRKFALENKLSIDEISHIPISMILNIKTDSDEQSIEQNLREYSEKEAEKHNVNNAVRLPQIISDINDSHVVPFQVSHANFITTKKISAPSLILYSNIEAVSMAGKIVIIEGADPGFDWIFAQKISGLITKYGGANSHMAIRCAEFSLPAAIGCGEQKFEQLLKSNHVHLDCSSGLIEPIH